MQLINEAKAVLKGKKVQFEHVPRENNQWADWLTRVAHHKKADGQMGDVTGEADWDGEPPDEGTVLCGMFSEGSEEGTNNCRRCQVAIRGAPLSCWGCHNLYHRTCLDALEMPMRKGPRHCSACRVRHRQRGTRDITLDESLLTYVALSRLPGNPQEAARVTRHANWVSIDDDGKLWIIGGDKPPRRVPPMKDREALVRQVGE